MYHSAPFDPRFFALMIPMVALVTAGVVGVVAILSHHWRKHRERELEVAFKNELLSRGMSADDIVRIVEAGRPPEDRTKPPSLWNRLGAKMRHGV